MANTVNNYSIVKPIFKDRKIQSKNKMAEEESRQAAISKRLKRMSDEKSKTSDNAKMPFKY